MALPPRRHGAGSHATTPARSRHRRALTRCLWSAAIHRRGVQDLHVGPHQKHQLQVSGFGGTRAGRGTWPHARSSGGPRGHHERVPRTGGWQTHAAGHCAGGCFGGGEQSSLRIYRTPEPSRLGETFRITTSNRRPALPSPVTKPRPLVPRPHGSNTSRDGDYTTAPSSAKFAPVWASRCVTPPPPCPSSPPPPLTGACWSPLPKLGARPMVPPRCPAPAPPHHGGECTRDV